MAELRVVQISDTHLSPVRSDAVPNVTAILDWIAAERPDLVVHTGDLVAEDPDDPIDAAFAHELLQRSGVPLVALPGNHDVGGFSGVRYERDRIDRFVRRWGADTFCLDLGGDAGWRVVGADVYRLGEPDHDDALAAALATSRPTALFIHQPICLVTPDRQDEGDWALPPAPRRRLLELIAGRPVRLVASGHLHRYRAGALPSGAATVWCPAASFIGTVRPDGSIYRVGLVDHRLGVDGIARHRLVEPPGVTLLRAGQLSGWWGP